VALGAVLLHAACAGAPETSAPEVNAPADIAAINALRDGFAKAYEAGDAAAFANLYTPDAISQPNHEPTVTGRDAVIEMHKNTFSQFAMKLEIMPDETRTMGNTGFDRGRYRMTVTPKAGGPAITNEGRYTVMLEKGDDGAWRVSRDIDNSTMPMPAPGAAPQ
jgi:uncharacterized protein (TIGR02246 family)